MVKTKAAHDKKSQFHTKLVWFFFFNYHDIFESKSYQGWIGILSAGD